MASGLTRMGKEHGFRRDYIDLARKMFKECCDPYNERVTIVYGPPGTGKTTLQNSLKIGLDTDDVRRVFGLHKGIDDELIFLLGIFISWAETSRRPNLGRGVVFTNLLDEVLKYSHTRQVDIRYLDIPNDSVIAERLAKRDGRDYSEMLNLVKEWDYGYIRTLVSTNRAFAKFEPSEYMNFCCSKIRLIDVKRELFGDLYLAIDPDEDWMLESNSLYADVDAAVIKCVKGRYQFVFSYDAMITQIVKQLFNFVYEHSSKVKHLMECGHGLSVATEQIVYRRILLVLLRDFYYEVYHNSAVCEYMYQGIENKMAQKAKVCLPLHVFSFTDFYSDSLEDASPRRYLESLQNGDVLSDSDQLDTLGRAYFSNFLRLRSEVENHHWRNLTAVKLMIERILIYYEPGVRSLFSMRRIGEIRTEIESVLPGTSQTNIVRDAFDVAHNIDEDWSWLWLTVERHFNKLCTDHHFQNAPKAGFYFFLTCWALCDIVCSGVDWYGDYDGCEVQE